jgi:hypothetical protein
MDNSSEEKKLYDEYITSYKKWVQYIELKIKYKHSELLSKNNKKYYKYEYLNTYITDIINENNIDTQSTESKLKYKKLSLLFHPDKFSTTTSIFSFINKHKYNIQILEIIDSISDKILDKTKEEIDIIIDKLYNKEFIDKILSLHKSSHNKDYFSIITLIDMISEDKYTENYMNTITQSMAYKYYLNEKEGKNILDLHWTEDELIKEIMTSYNINFLEYFKKICKDNEEIVNHINNRLQIIELQNKSIRLK